MVASSAFAVFHEFRDICRNATSRAAAADPALLLRRFGPHIDAWLHDAAHGRDERPIVTEREPKSISRDATFERDLHPVRDRHALRPGMKLASDPDRLEYRDMIAMRGLTGLPVSFG